MGRVRVAPPELRSQILTLTFGLGASGAAGAWIVDRRLVVHPIQLGVVIGLAFGIAAIARLLRRRLPRYTEDGAVVLSIALISVAACSTRVDVDPAFVAPYYIWVGFAAPMWFPRRRAEAYLLLTAAVSGIVLCSAGTAVAAATWIVTTITLLVAFVFVRVLARMRLRSERLAVVGEMTSAVGHELRNPLGATTSSLLLVRTALDDGDVDGARNYLALAEQSVGRAIAVADELTAYVGLHRPAVVDVDLDDLLDDVTRGAAPPGGVTVRRRLATPRVVADRSQLAAVVSNLLSNAYDAMPEGGVVTVASADAPAGSVSITVEDTGRGIDDAVRDTLFEPFVTNKARGTGLGLAVVLRFVEAHGGDISCESVPGRGTRMTVQLPAREALPPAGRAAAPRRRSPSCAV